ncbi:MAG: hypothetical protein ACYDBJ_15415 [Aggregatilineales bacterium]
MTLRSCIRSALVLSMAAALIAVLFSLTSAKSAQASTPTLTPTATSTPTASNTPSMTGPPPTLPPPSNTPFPSCSNLSITGGNLGVDNLQLNVINLNTAPVYINDATIHWSPHALALDPLLFVDTLAVVGQPPFWDYVTLNPLSAPGQGTGSYTLPAAITYSNGWQTSGPPDGKLQIPGSGSTPVQITFGTPSYPLSSNLTINDFGGASITFTMVTGANPTPSPGTLPGGQNCTIALNVVTPTPNLTPTVTPSASPTCSISNYNLAFVLFQNFGQVQLQFANNTSVPVYISGFSIHWGNYSGLLVSEVDLNGTNAFAQPPAIQLWSGNSTYSPTNSSSGIWQTNGSVFSNSAPNFWVVFSGTSSTVPGQPSDFIGTTVTFTNGCVVTLNGTATALPTSTSTPTATKTNTPTSTNTLTATLSFIPSNTPTSTNTLTATLLFTPSNVPTTTPSFTATNTPTSTPTSTLTPTATNTCTQFVTYTPTPIGTFTPIPTYTPTSTFIPLPSPTPPIGDHNVPMSGSCAPTDTATPTSTPTSTFTPTATNTPAFTLTFTPSNTSTPMPTIAPTSTPIPLRIDSIGIFRNGTFYLRLHNSTGFADLTVAFNPANSPYPVVGDWTGAGFDTVGVYDQNTGAFYLCNVNDTATCAAAFHVQSFTLGNPNDQPLSGRWIAGATTFGAGVFRPSNGLIYLRNALTTGFADYTMVMGIPGDVGLAGDWNGDGLDSSGVYRPSNSTFYLTDQVCNCAVIGSYQFTYGIGGDAPVIGDWIGQGHDGVGLFRQSNGFTYLRNSLSTGFADITFTYGIAGDVPVAGHWQLIYPPISHPGSVIVPSTLIPTAVPVPTGGLQD